MSSKVFAYIWEYKVKSEHCNAFKHAYGPKGEWVKLFKTGNGHIATELHCDNNDPQHFVTIDYWISKEARDTFKKEFESAFNALDNKFEEFTLAEKHVGDFESYIKEPSTR